MGMGFRLLKKKEIMKYKVEVRTIQSDHILASPVFNRYEYVDTNDIDSWIENNLTDNYGHSFKKASKKTKETFGVDYTSHAGSLVLHKYIEPNFKT